MRKPTVFVSYSHRDELWKDRLRPHLTALEQAGRIAIWDDRQIDPGQRWYDEIKKVIDEAAVAVCLISPDYLASDFCVKEEIPYLLERRDAGGVTLIPVLLRSCPWKAFEWLRETQMFPRDGRTVAADYEARWDEAFAQVAEHVFEILDAPAQAPPPEPRPEPQAGGPEHVDTSRLHMSARPLFGRQGELAVLNAAWEAPDPKIVALVSWGGGGKTELVSHWLGQLARRGYAGARRVFGWTFGSCADVPEVSSADAFMTSALAWFGDLDPAAGSPWDRGERLATLVCRQRTLLVLDRLEWVLGGHGEQGVIGDPAFATFLFELARENPGLCVLMSRERLVELDRFGAAARQLDLELISAAAGRALLRAGGVRGSDAELEAATRAFGNNTLALSLLAAYLKETGDGAVADAARVPDLPIDDAAGRHVRRVLSAFESCLGAAEVELMRLLALLERAADPALIAALRAPPGIPYLNEALQGLDDEALRALAKGLAKRRLVFCSRGGEIDTHPLVREHFREQFALRHADAWRAGNARVYEFLKARAAPYPDTLQAMEPLYAAVKHGCRAGRHVETLREVLWKRISRGRDFYSARALGAFSANLAALAGFFETPWTRPVSALPPRLQSAVLSWAGFSLRALGRMAESADPIRLGMELSLASRDWKEAAIAAGNLSQVHLALGEVAQAEAVAREAVALAERTGSAFESITKQAVLADALFHAGRVEEAERLFEAAEARQAQLDPDCPWLHSVEGFAYHLLLLHSGRPEAVRSRVQAVADCAGAGASPLDAGLRELALACTYLLEAERGGAPRKRIAFYLEEAQAALSSARREDFKPLCILAQARLARLAQDWDGARRLLARVGEVARRSGMALVCVDAAIEGVRLANAMGDKDRALLGLARARTAVRDAGYHLRDAELMEIETVVGGTLPGLMAPARVGGPARP